jgi:hypothetical protein
MAFWTFSFEVLAHDCLKLDDLIFQRQVFGISLDYLPFEFDFLFSELGYFCFQVLLDQRKLLDCSGIGCLLIFKDYIL